MTRLELVHQINARLAEFDEMKKEYAAYPQTEDVKNSLFIIDGEIATLKRKLSDVMNSRCPIITDEGKDGEKKED